MSEKTIDGGTSRPGRSIHLIGETGEIEGYMEDGEFVVRHPNAHSAHTYSEERVDINVSRDMHGGGDLRLAGDFVATLQGKPRSISSTRFGRPRAFATRPSPKRRARADR